VLLAVLYGGERGGGGAMGDLHRLLAGLSGPPVQSLDRRLLLADRPEAVFLATPHEVAAEMAPAILEAGSRVIDLSGAHRLRDPEAVRRWYGFTPAAPALLAESVYGLTEWCNGELAAARLVANPGCYATSILLALKPVLDRLDPGQSIVCDSKSGTSGAGRRSDAAYGFSELDGNVRAYGVAGHRHDPEIRQALGLSESARFCFVPHLLPMVRGILSTNHVRPTRSVTQADVDALYAAAYADEPFVRVVGTPPATKHTTGSNVVLVHVRLDERTGRIIAIAVEDNLVKGAAGQAVQAFNVVHGLPEIAGLEQLPLAP